MKKQIFNAALLLASLGLAGVARADSFEVYGQVNKALVWLDQDNGTDATRFGDNDKSSTRFGIRGEKDIGRGLKASFLIEDEVQDGDNTGSMGLGVSDDASALPLPFAENHARVGLAGEYGAVFVGRTAPVMKDINEVDLGSVTDLMGADMTSVGGGIDFGPQSWRNSYSHLDLSYANLVRYDSPVFNGFQAGVSVANGGDVDTALRYNGQLGSIKLAGGFGFARFNSDAVPPGANTEQLSGSISAKHASGLNATFAAGQEFNDGSVADPKFWYAKLGYDVGQWGFAIDRGVGRDVLLDEVAGKAWGVGTQYSFGNGVSLALMYREATLDFPGVDIDPAQMVATSIRMKF